MCGPFVPHSWNQKRYFVPLTDDQTHFTVLHLLNSKDEVLEHFIEYEAKVTACFGSKIARLRCDNGGEYSSTAGEELSWTIAFRTIHNKMELPKG